MFNALADFFTPEAGQRRRQWLNEQEAALGNVLSGYLGPAAQPIQSAAMLAGYMTPGADMMEAADASGRLMNATGPMDAAAEAAALAGAVGMTLLPGSYNALSEGFQSTVDDMVGAYDPAVVNSTRLNSRTLYHGSPDVRDVVSQGGFNPRQQYVRYITDPQEYQRIAEELRLLPPDAPQRADMASTLNALVDNQQIPAPIFMTDSLPIARSYADPWRAMDYQNADAGVLPLRTSPQNVLDIDAQGAGFRGLSSDAVRTSLRNTGLSDADIDALFSRSHRYLYGEPGMLSTDDTAAIVQGLGFDAIDVANVRDSYKFQSAARPSTVRMMFNPSQIELAGRPMPGLAP
jgi:hypothetical protein